MVHALISVYHPSESAKQNIVAIASQVDQVYVCDNTPAPDRQLCAELNTLDHVQYICFGQNLGLSRAFNQILKDPQIPWKGDDYVIFFDQDSLIAEHHIERMISIYESVRQNGHPIGCLGPVYYNTSSGMIEIPKSKKSLQDSTYCVSSLITSSLMSTYSALRDIGFWNERVFLDMADWDLCWRLKAAGKLCCMTTEVVLHHSVGYGVKKFGPVKLHIGQPFREYYQIRECQYLMWKPYTPLKYRIRFLAMLLIRSPLHVLLLDHKKKRLHYILKGFTDFWRGKTGSLDTEEPTTE